MWLYNLIFISICFTCFFRKKNQLRIYILFMIIFWIMSFIRWEVGTDWNTYLATFKVADNFEKMTSVNEFGFKLLNFLVHKYTQNYTVLLFVIGTIIFIPKYITSRQFSLFLPLTLLLDFVMQKSDIFFTRQAIAVAITYFSIKYIFQKNFIKFLICIVLACFFHKSALIFIFSYFLINNFNLNVKKMIILLIITIILSYNSYNIFIFIGNFLPGLYGSKILRYIERGDNLFGYKEYLNKNMVLLVLYLNKAFLVGIGFYFYKVLNLKLKKLFQLYMISICIYILLSPLSITLGRLANYYEIVQIIIFPSLYVYIKKNKINQIIFLLIFFIYCYLKLISSLSGYSSLVHYKTIFNK